VSIAENLDLQLYRESAEAIMCALLPDSPTATSSRTDGNVPFFLSHTHRCTYVYIQKGHHGFSVKLHFFFFFFFFFSCACVWLRFQEPVIATQMYICVYPKRPAWIFCKAYYFALFFFFFLVCLSLATVSGASD